MRRMDFWERVQHAGLVGYAKAEGAASQEEDDAIAWSYHDMVFSGKL